MRERERESHTTKQTNKHTHTRCAGLQQMMERELQQAGENKEEEETYKVKKKTHDLLPNADENMRKLKVRN